MDNTKAVASISQVIRQRILDAQASWDHKSDSIKQRLSEASAKLQAFELEVRESNKTPIFMDADLDSTNQHSGELTSNVTALQNELKLLGERPRFHAADNISQYIESEEEKQAIQNEVAAGFQQVLNAMVIDTDHDHNTNETAKRVAKMYIREVFRGRYDEAPKITEFPNDRNLDEVIVIGPFKVRSACSHHFVPIMGSLWIGIKPGKSVAGLSKYGRLAEWILARPHIQEEAVIMLADALEQLVDPAGLIVSISAAHMCMSWRGIKDNASTTTSIVRGDFRKNPALKKEFFDQVRIMQNDKSLGH